MLRKIFSLFWISGCVMVGSDAFAQVISVNCYEQNARISGTVSNLISNGSFENTTCPPWDDVTAHSFCPSSNYYDCTLQGWTTTCGTSSYPLIFDSTRVVIPDGNLAVYLGNSSANACSATAGDTSCLGIANCEVTGITDGYPYNPGAAYNGVLGIGLEQTVSGLIIDSVYVLEFWAGGEDGYFNKGLFAVNVGFGNIFLRDKRTEPAAIGTRFLVRFKATASAHTIKFTNWGHICGTCTELVLDDVRLYTSAEFTGINEASAIDAVVITNPFSNEIKIVNFSFAHGRSIVLYDYTGKEILRKKPSGAETTINTESVAVGLYFLRIEDGKRLRNYKVVKGN
jgi:hypothetical protein